MIDKQILIMELTSNCNNYCEHCLRAGMNENNYSMKYEEVIKALNEIERFSKHFDNFELKLSGGESTIWRDKDYNIIDILKACKEKNIEVALVTNGIVFKKEGYTDNFFNELGLNKEEKLKIYVTIDKYHKNYEKDDENEILDNLLKHDENVELYVQSTVNKNKDNISMEFIKKYSEKNIKFLMNPLLPWGRGEKLRLEVPFLELDTNSKDNLGEYKKYFYILGLSKKIWSSYEEFEQKSNIDIIKALNHCGKTITFMENKYFYCMPQSGKKDFCFSKLGELDYDSYMEYVRGNDWINSMRNNEIGKEIKNCCIGYGICDLCRELYRRK